MEYKVEVSQTVDENEWNKKLLENRASTAYQISNWAKIYRSFDSKPIFITVRDSTGEIVGQLLAMIHNKLLWSDTNSIIRFVGGRLNLGPTLTWFYGPIIHDNENHNAIVSKIISTIDTVSLKNKITMTRGWSHPSSNQLASEIFLKSGYVLQPWSTYITDLTPDADIFYENLDKKTRYDVRKSEKNSLEFVVADDRTSLDEFVLLKTQEKTRANEKINDNTEFYDDRWLHLEKYGYEKLFLAKYNGETIAGILNIIFNRNVIQHGVSVSTKRDLLGGPFLTWNAIKWCVDMKYSTYDMGGINPNPETDKEKSMNFYKSKWGGKRSDYARYTKIYDNTKWKLSKGLRNPKSIKRIFK